MVVITGKDTSLVYLWEDHFDQDPDAVTDDITMDMFTFGANVTLGTNEGANNAERQFRPGSRQAEYILEQQFDGSWSVDFTLTNPWFLRSMFGTPTSEPDNDTEPTEYEHTFDGQFPHSLQLVEQVEHEDGRIDHRIYTGCIVSSVDVDVDVEGVAEISVDGAYADELLVTDVNNEEEAPYSEYDQPGTDHRPYHFGNAKMFIDREGDADPETTTMERRIQDASLSMEGNVDIIYELGSRIGADFSPKALEPDLSYTRLLEPEDTQDIRDMYGGESLDSPADPTMGESDVEVQLQFDNAQTVDDEVDKNIITFVCEGGLVDSYSRNNVGDPESDIEADVDRLISRVWAYAENEEEAPY